MDKSAKSKSKDKLRHRGKVWVDDPSRDIRDISGVTFGGRYLTYEQYRAYRSRRKNDSTRQP